MNIELPSWITEWKAPEPHAGHEDRMRAVIDLVRLNIRHRTGGPFASIIVNDDTGVVAGIGVNLVTSLNLSILHAEMVAIMMAEEAAGTWDLGATGRFTIYASAEPCAMCMGAIPWSGLRTLVIGARDEDIRAIGFDEGVKADNWIDGYTQRNIHVIRDVCRAESAAALKEYVVSGGHIYNG